MIVSFKASFGGLPHKITINYRNKFKILFKIQYDLTRKFICVKTKIALKCLHNSQGITNEFVNEV